MIQQETLMRQLVDKLNQASEAYYNGKGELMTDYEWDAMFDELKLLEEETGITRPTLPQAKCQKTTWQDKKKNMSLLPCHSPRPRA